MRAVVESEDEVAVTEHEDDEGAVVETAEVYVVGVPTVEYTAVSNPVRCSDRT